MIAKFKHIQNLAVFKNFDWDSSVKAKNGRVMPFAEINILYGRNYSGKTTLSRISRAIETGHLSDKYENPQFAVELKDGTVITHAVLSSRKLDIRVFNEDFVRDNLKFIYDPDADIASFAILGSNNNEIETQIALLVDELGNCEDGKESGLYKESKDARVNASTAARDHDIESSALQAKIKQKAIDREIGIKYKPDRFGDQNYNTGKLENDIATVLDESYMAASDEAVVAMESLLREVPKVEAKAIHAPTFQFSQLAAEARLLVEKNTVESNKIKELVENALLNRWVNEGRDLHKEKRDFCSFCGSSISPSRWEELDKHFDKESEQLSKDIDSLIGRISKEKGRLNESFVPDSEQFYSEFHGDLNELIRQYRHASESQLGSLVAIEKQLEKRKSSIFVPQVFVGQPDLSSSLDQIFSAYAALKQNSDASSAQLARRQTEARATLRLKEVCDFVRTIDYAGELRRIALLEEKANESKGVLNALLAAIDEKQKRLGALKNQLNDEEKGARKVNEYLNDFFGHKFLSLEAIESSSMEAAAPKKFRFEVVRDGKKAHHLSEGECSLISFCYFVARLHDIDTANQRPVVWIDDPISSLDENHIFFLYSLLKTELVDRNAFGQLFVSTHNLAFLKYLKRLQGAFVDSNGQRKAYDRQFFIIDREDRYSKIQVMPKYLKDYVTEFNFLFGQIHRCSEIENVDDKNYMYFYNFGNNARKFLEIYLFYKYPDATDETEKLKRFFADMPIPAILTERINNEYSHLCAAFERGAIPVDAPEMRTAARQIVLRLKTIDPEQFSALLNSIDGGT